MEIIKSFFSSLRLFGGSKKEVVQKKSKWYYQHCATQRSQSENAITCIAMILSLFNRVDFTNKKSLIKKLIRQNPDCLMNSDTKSIAIACKKFDLHPEIFACSASELRKMQLPCLIYWKLDRFVVLIEMDEYYFYVLDPAHNQIEFSFDDFECYFCEEGVSFRGSIKNENLLRTED